MAVIIIFQACLALGAPWGAASMGGKFPGRYPARMRVVAIINTGILTFLVLIVLARAHVAFPTLYVLSTYLIWMVVVLGFLSVVLHIITRSKIERIWLPFTIVHFTTSLIVALN